MKHNILFNDNIRIKQLNSVRIDSDINSMSTMARIVIPSNDRLKLNGSNILKFSMPDSNERQTKFLDVKVGDIVTIALGYDDTYYPTVLAFKGVVKTIEKEESTYTIVCEDPMIAFKKQKVYFSKKYSKLIDVIQFLVNNSGGSLTQTTEDDYYYYGTFQLAGMSGKFKISKLELPNLSIIHYLTNYEVLEKLRDNLDIYTYFKLTDVIENGLITGRELYLHSGGKYSNIGALQTQNYNYSYIRRDGRIPMLNINSLEYINYNKFTDLGIVGTSEGLMIGLVGTSEGGQLYYTTIPEIESPKPNDTNKTLISGKIIKLVTNDEFQKIIGVKTDIKELNYKQISIEALIKLIDVAWDKVQGSDTGGINISFTTIANYFLDKSDSINISAKDHNSIMYIDRIETSLNSSNGLTQSITATKEIKKTTT